MPSCSSVTIVIVVEHRVTGRAMICSWLLIEVVAACTHDRTDGIVAVRVGVADAAIAVAVVCGVKDWWWSVRHV